LAKLVGGSGSGKPEIAGARGNDQAQIFPALQTAPKLIGELSA
jgi:alanyl-tRNA synthetase